MSTQRYTFFSFTVLMTVIGCGCLLEGFRYSVILQNKGSTMLSDGNVIYNGFQSGGGYLSPNANKGYGFVTYPIPEVATVQFRTEDGILHKKEVVVKSKAPKKMQRGRIYFIIHENYEVEVKFETEKEYDERLRSMPNK